MRRLPPSPAPPSVIRGAVSQARKLLDSIDDDYPSAYRASYESGSGAEVRSGGQNYAEDGSVPGPTASVAANKENMRNGLSEATRKLLEALGSIRSARSLVARRLTEGEQTEQRKDPENWTEHELAEAEQRSRQRPSQKWERTA